jgi:hypothetical protein
MVMVVAMPRNISAGASSLSASPSTPSAPSAQIAGTPRRSMPEDIATTISR